MLLLAERIANALDIFISEETVTLHRQQLCRCPPFSLRVLHAPRPSPPPADSCESTQYDETQVHQPTRPTLSS